MFAAIGTALDDSLRCDVFGLQDEVVVSGDGSERPHIDRSPCRSRAHYQIAFCQERGEGRAVPQLQRDVAVSLREIGLTPRERRCARRKATAWTRWSRTRRALEIAVEVDGPSHFWGRARPNWRKLLHNRVFITKGTSDTRHTTRAGLVTLI